MDHLVEQVLRVRVRQGEHDDVEVVEDARDAVEQVHDVLADAGDVGEHLGVVHWGGGLPVDDVEGVALVEHGAHEVGQGVGGLAAEVCVEDEAALGAGLCAGALGEQLHGPDVSAGESLQRHAVVLVAADADLVLGYPRLGGVQHVVDAGAEVGQHLHAQVVVELLVDLEVVVDVADLLLVGLLVVHVVVVGAVVVVVVVVVVVLVFFRVLVHDPQPHRRVLPQHRPLEELLLPHPAAGGGPAPGPRHAASVWVALASLLLATASFPVAPFQLFRVELHRGGRLRLGLVQVRLRPVRRGQQYALVHRSSVAVCVCVCVWLSLSLLLVLCLKSTFFPEL